MQISGIWAYAVIEALIILSIYTAYLYLTKRRLNQPQPVPGIENNESGNNEPYSALLQAEIRHAEDKLAQLESDSEPDLQLKKIVETRLTVLHGERQARDDSSPENDNFWQQISRTYSSLLPIEETDTEVNQTTAAALQARIQAYETRIASLEKFKTNFFELKEKHAETSDLNQKLQAEVEKAVPEDQQSPELRDTLQKLKEENARLENQLSQIENEFTDIIRQSEAGTEAPATVPAHAKISESVNHIEQSVEQVKQVVASQTQQITELNKLIAELEIEVKEKEELEQALERFNNKQTEFQDIIEVMEEENTFLQEQISALLAQELEKEALKDAAALEQQKKLDEQSLAYAELEKKYASMEHEYLSLYEENQKLKG